jgi:hypothetical protein
MTVEEIPNKPSGHESCLSDFGPCVFDGCCGEPVGWGFRIIERIDAQRFAALGAHGSLECLYSESLQPQWYLVTKWLSREEAQRKYGDITAEKFGPRGGWKSVTFGGKTFISPHFKVKQP